MLAGWYIGMFNPGVQQNFSQNVVMGSQGKLSGFVVRNPAWVCKDLLLCLLDCMIPSAKLQVVHHTQHQVDVSMSVALTRICRLAFCSL